MAIDTEIRGYPPQSQTYLADWWRNLRAAWHQSVLFRRVLVIVLVWMVLRLGIQGLLIAGTILTDDLVGMDPASTLPVDMQIYLTAAENFAARESLYLQGSLQILETHYPYAPSFALAFTPFLQLSPFAVALVHTLLHIAAYIWLYLSWNRIFGKLGLPQAQQMLIWTLPAWLIFSTFWSDLAYLNIYLIMALFATLLIEAVLEERLFETVLWLAVILQIKPHWAFAAAIPLLLGRYRFFIRMIGFSVVAYAGIVVATGLVGGFEYVLAQYREYVEFLARLSEDFPWRGPDAPFLGYNHSITQISVYLFGEAGFPISMIVKIALLAPLAALGLRCLLRPIGQPGHRVPQVSLDLAFVLYMGAFIWLDMVWELSLGIAVFTYLRATVENRRRFRWVWVLFVVYAVIDVWQALSYIVLGDAAIVPGPYVITDPSIYLPIIMLVLLSFYGLLLVRLWRTAHA
ncbi:MAG: DUF2029 domain-containing protein, partial [Chloroflexi bacterium]|nr:DUF2029 domain-containing protein [Chloroflexota bacterium]